MQQRISYRPSSPRTISVISLLLIVTMVLGPFGNLRYGEGTVSTGATAVGGIAPMTANGADSPIMLNSLAAWVSPESFQTRSVAWGDVNNDGDLDLAVGNTNEVKNKLYSTVNGTLQDFESWSSNEKDDSSKVAWGDYNNDGYLDLAVANDGGGDGQPTRIYKNDGGTLSDNAVWSSQESDQTQDLAWADMNNDGYLDMVVASFGYLRVYINNGGSFSNSSTWSSDDEIQAKSLALGDYDKDGWIDIAVGIEEGEIYLYHNDKGNISGKPVLTTVETDETQQIAWVDIDKDGDLDLAKASLGSPGLRLYRNDGGVLEKNAYYNSSGLVHDVRSMAWGDCDGNGYQDVALGLYHSNISILRNDGGVLSSYFVWNSTDFSDWLSLAWGDYNNDGALDLAAGSTSYVFVFENEMSPFLGTISWSSTDTDGTMGLALGDYNKDGYLDLATGNYGPSNQTKVYKNNNGALPKTASWKSAYSDYGQAVAWADYDGDGDLDLAAGNPGYSGGGSIRLYRNDNGILRNWAVWNASENPSSTALAWGDYDKDGDLDLATADNGGSGEVNRIYRNDNGTLTLKSVWNSTETDQSTSVAWADYDHDGYPDLSFGNYNGRIKIYHNDKGNLSTTATWTSSEIDNTNSIAWGDYDKDGDPDLAAGNSMGKVRVYRNDGGVISPTATWSSSDMYWISAVKWVDVDLDGDLDLVAVPSNGPVFVFQNNNGELSKTPFWTSPDLVAGTCLDSGDVDGDGVAELVVGSMTKDQAFDNRVGSLQNRNPYVALSPLPGKLKGDVTINYKLFDPEGDPSNIIPYFSTNSGATWSKATMGKGSDPTTRLTASKGGTAHKFVWDSDADGVNSTHVRIKIFTMDFPTTGPIQKINYLSMSSDLTVTNYWPRYTGGIDSVIVKEDTNWTLDLNDHFKDLDDGKDNLTFTVNYTGFDPKNPQVTVDPLTHIAKWSPKHGDTSIEDLVFTSLDPQGHRGLSTPIILFYLEVNEPPIYLGRTDPKLRLHDAFVKEDSRWSVDLDDYFWDEEKDSSLIFTSNRSEVSIDPITHIASWQPVHGSVSIKGLVFTVMDPDNSSMTDSSNPINLTYVEVNDQGPVYVGGLGDTLVYEDSNWSVDLDTVFYDEESNPQLYDGNLSFLCSHPQISINSTTHVASWSPGHGNETLFSVSFTALDPDRPWYKATSPTFTLYYFEVNDMPPVYLGGLDHETTVDEDSVWSINLGQHFYDEESGSALIYRTDAPEVSIDQVTHVATWRPVHGSHDIVMNITAVDPLDLNWSVSVKMVLRYHEVNDQPPTYLGGLQSALVPEDTVWSMDLDRFFSDEEMAPLTFEATHQAVKIDPSTHVASWAPVHGSSSLVALAFLASDGKFNTESEPITLTYLEVNDQPPVYLGGLANALHSPERTWKVDLDNYFTDEESPNTLIYTCNRKDVKIDPITHEASWTPSNDKTTTLKGVVFTAHDPMDANKTVYSEALSLKVPQVPTDYLIVIGPIGLTLLDILGYGFSIVMFIGGAYFSTRKIRLTAEHKKRIRAIKDQDKLRKYYKKKVRPDIERGKVTPVQALLLKDAIEERTLKLKEAPLSQEGEAENSQDPASNEDLDERMDKDDAEVQGHDGPSEDVLSSKEEDPSGSKPEAPRIEDAPKSPPQEKDLEPPKGTTDQDNDVEDDLFKK